MCNINWGDDYCINHLFWVTITMYFTFLVDILLEFVNMSKKVSIFRHSNSVLASNVVGVLNLDSQFGVVPKQWSTQCKDT